MRLRHRQTAHPPAMDRNDFNPVGAAGANSADISSRVLADKRPTALIGKPFFPGGDKDEQSAYPIGV